MFRIFAIFVARDCSLVGVGFTLLHSRVLRLRNETRSLKIFSAVYALHSGDSIRVRKSFASRFLKFVREFFFFVEIKLFDDTRNKKKKKTLKKKKLLSRNIKKREI